MRIATVLPGRPHDTLNPLLRVLPWPPQQLILGLIRCGVTSTAARVVEGAA